MRCLHPKVALIFCTLMADRTYRYYLNEVNAEEKHCTNCGGVWIKQWSWVRYVPPTDKNLTEEPHL